MPWTPRSWSLYRSVWRAHRWMLALWIVSALCVLAYGTLVFTEVETPWKFVLLLIGLGGAMAHDRLAGRIADRPTRQD